MTRMTADASMNKLEFERNCITTIIAYFGSFGAQMGAGYTCITFVHVNNNCPCHKKKCANCYLDKDQVMLN